MLYFFDTSALKHRYRTSPRSRGIRRLISDKRNECYISSATVIEIYSACGAHYRDDKPARDPAEFHSWIRSFWQDVYDGVLTVRRPGEREEAKALHLLVHAGVDLKRSIKTFDALIAATCLELALEKMQKIRFWTGDQRLHKVVSGLDAYKAVMHSTYVKQH